MERFQTNGGKLWFLIGNFRDSDPAVCINGIYQRKWTGVFDHGVCFFDKNTLLGDPVFFSATVFQKGMQGYITLFIPIIASFSFVRAFCEERNTGFMKYSIMRSGRVRGYLSKALTAVLSGGLVVMLGDLLFAGAVFLLFPGRTDYADAGLFDLSAQLVGNSVSIVLNEMGSLFLYGVVMTLPALVCCSFCSNPYIIAGVPFFLVYVQQCLVDKLYQKGIEDGNFDFAGNVYDFSPHAIKRVIYQLNQPEHVKRIIVLNGLMLGISLICFIRISLYRKEHDS